MFKKMFVLSFIMLFVSGCSVEYNLEINENSFTDNFIIKYTEEDLINKDNDEELMGNRLKALIDYDVYPLFQDYSVSYTKKNVVNKEKNNLILNHDYSISDFKNANVINSCFKNKAVVISDDNININLNGYFYCLYNNEEILINVKTDYNVFDENADYKNNNVYSWKINKDNYENISIKLSLKTEEDNIIDSVINNINKYEDEKVSNSFVHLYIILGILSLVLIIFVFVKVKTSNKK